MSDRSAIGEARRAAIAAAERLGFDAERRSDIGIVATEAATNAIVHAQTGEMVVSEEKEPQGAWLDLVTLDSGAGIHDVAEASRDGFSSGGTAGQGLGAIVRLSDESAIYSQSSRGTVNWSRFFLEQTAERSGEYGVVSVPMQGETACGDSYLALPGQARSVFMVVDGLGHGPQAAEAADEAVVVTQRYIGLPGRDILVRAHDALRKTRGAAMSIAVVDHQQRLVTYAGVGNISAAIERGPQARSLVSQNGTLGAVLPRQIQEYQYPFEPGALLVMFSDGLNSKTAISGYSGLQNRHPQLAAGVLYRDFSRKRDDATVLIARLEGPVR